MPESNNPPSDQPGQRPELVVALAQRKMNELFDEVETWRSISGELFESLPLTGALALRRKIMEDGTKGPISMSYQVVSFLGRSAWHEEVVTSPEGKATFVYDDPDKDRRRRRQALNGVRKAILAAKILKGRPDHWDRYSDSHGTDKEP